MKHPWRITIDTNPDQCNLNCIMCDTHSIYNKSKIKRQRMPKERLKSILKEAVDVGVKEIIPSTMGEPLLYPYFGLFVDYITDSNTKLNLTTNGTFPKKGVEDWANILLPITSDTKISINGVSESINKKVMIGADTQESLNSIKTYLSVRDEIRKKQPNHKPTVTLQVTFMKGHLKGIKEVIEFAIEHQVDRVKGHHLWVTHPELITEDLRHSENKGIWNDFIKEIAPYQQQIKLENFVKLSEEISTIPEHYHCPFLNKELWIDCSGNYNVCCAPSDKRQSLGDFGNISKISISDIFNQENYQNLVQNYKNKPLCQNCLLRKPENA